jgi:hypothetical protein
VRQKIKLSSKMRPILASALQHAAMNRGLAQQSPSSMGPLPQTCIPQPGMEQVQVQVQVCFTGPMLYVFSATRAKLVVRLPELPPLREHGKHNHTPALTQWPPSRRHTQATHA